MTAICYIAPIYAKYWQHIKDLEKVRWAEFDYYILDIHKEKAGLNHLLKIIKKF